MDGGQLIDRSDKSINYITRMKWNGTCLLIAPKLWKVIAVLARISIKSVSKNGITKPALV